MLSVCMYECMDIPWYVEENFNLMIWLLDSHYCDLPRELHRYMQIKTSHECRWFGCMK